MPTTDFDGVHAAVLVIGTLVVLAFVGIVLTAVVRSVRMARRGQNPLPVPEDLADRAARSQALAPVRSKAERLAEIDGLLAAGGITAAERDAARARILAE